MSMTERAQMFMMEEEEEEEQGDQIFKKSAEDSDLNSAYSGGQSTQTSDENF